MADYVAIGKNIRKYRHKRNLTQEELGFRINTSAAYISCIERSIKKPSLDTLLRICAVLEVDPNELLGASGNAELHSHYVSSLPLSSYDIKNIISVLTQLLLIMEHNS